MNERETALHRKRRRIRDNYRRQAKLAASKQKSRSERLKKLGRHCCQ